MTITEPLVDISTDWTIEPNEDLVSRATSLLEMSRQFADSGAEAGRVDQAVVDEMERLGLFKLTVPRRYGGYEVNSRTFTEVLSELARGDASVGWSAMLINIGNWFATTWSEQAQDDIWGKYPDGKTCVVLVPSATGLPVEGGYVVTGKWPYASGSYVATHAMMGFMAQQPDGSQRFGLGIMMPGEWTIEQSWDPIGMRGTGSNTAVAEQVFIPQHRIQWFEDMVDDKYATEFARVEPRSRAPFLATGTVIFGACLIGMAKAALELTIERLQQKGVAGTAYALSKNSPSHQIQVARAAGLIDAAEQLMFRADRDIDLSAINDEPLSQLDRARVRHDVGMIVDFVCEAVDILLKAGGTSGFMKSNALSRIFQDVFTGGSHVHATPGIATDVYGKLLLGADEPIPAHV